MKKLLTLAFVALVSCAFAQNKETRKISDFNEISVSQGIKAEIIGSVRNEVVVDCENQAHLALLETVVKNGTLFIRYKPNSNIQSKRPSEVKIYASPNVSAIQVSSAALLNISAPVKSSNIDARVSSSGTLLFKSLRADKLTLQTSSSSEAKGEIAVHDLAVNSSSSSTVILTGSTNTADINTSSSSTANLKDVKANHAVVSASSSSTILVQVTGELTGKVSSSATVINTAKAKLIQVKESSSGSVKAM